MGTFFTFAQATLGILLPFIILWILRAVTEIIKEVRTAHEDALWSREMASKTYKFTRLEQPPNQSMLTVVFTDNEAKVHDVSFYKKDIERLQLQENEALKWSRRD